MVAARDAGFGMVLANVGDYEPSEWDLIRGRARDAGIKFGPWLRTADANTEFVPQKLLRLIDIAESWGGTPLVCNSEKEIDHTGDDITAWIAQQLDGLDAAISMEVQPFGAVDWTPFARAGLPVLPQHFPAETGRHYSEDAIREMWWDVGINCVVITYGSYHGMQAVDFARLSPYGVYTGNDTGGQFHLWAPTGEIEPCKEEEEDLTRIGSQNGIEATYNRWKKLDPEGCNPAFDPKLPFALPVEQLKAYDKWVRTMTILVNDHDASV